MKTARDEEFRIYVLAQRAPIERLATELAAGDRALADSIVQLALTRVYLAWPALRKLSDPQSIVRRFLVTALLSEGRRPWRRLEPRADDFPADVEDLYRALRDLPIQTRVVAVLRCVRGLDVLETADALSCAHSEVEARTARAVEALRRLPCVPAGSSDDELLAHLRRGPDDAVAGSADAPSPLVVDSDVARGQRALRRHHARARGGTATQTSASRPHTAHRGWSSGR
jgi:DNA-directed RNA polymerase specialized sigma24 family protein